MLVYSIFFQRDYNKDILYLQKASFFCQRNGRYNFIQPSRLIQQPKNKKEEKKVDIWLF